jgi:hypothetical protein
VEGQQACRGVCLGDDGSPWFLTFPGELVRLSKDGERLGALGFKIGDICF